MMRFLALLSIVLVAVPLAAPAQTPGATESNSVEAQVTAYFQAGKYVEALKLAKQNAEAIKKKEEAEGKTHRLTAVALGGVAWYALFAKKPKVALDAAERAIALDPGVLWFETNRAHALLFLDRTPTAVKAYASHKGETIPGQGKWEDVILKDFAEFRTRGLSHPKFKLVEEALANAPENTEALNETQRKLTAAGRYADALPWAKRYVEAVEKDFGKNHPKYASAIDALAGIFYALRLYDDAGALLQRALDIRERSLGKDNPDTIQSADHLAQFYYTKNRFNDAEPLYMRVLEARERTLGKEHSDTLATVNALAGLKEARSHHDEAEALFRRVLMGRERILGPQHPATIQSAYNLAWVLDKQNRFAEVEPLLQRVIKAREDSFGKDNPDTLTSVNALAHVYQAQKRFGEAEPLFKRVLEANERILGKEHANTLGSVKDLAKLYWAQGRYNEAEPLLKRVLQWNERVFGPDHQDTLSSMNELGVLLDEQGRYSEAEPLLKRAAEGFARMLGAEHPDTLAVNGNLAASYRGQGRYNEAEPILTRVLAAREKVQGKDHPDTLESVNNLAFLYQEEGRYAEAEPLYKRALSGRERVLGPDHPNTLGTEGNLALLYQAQGRYSEAEPLYKHALAGRERVLGEEHPETLKSVSSLGFLYHAQGRYGEAEPLFKRVLAVRERVLGPEHISTLRSVDNLAILYDDEGRYAEAEPLHKRALASFERIHGPDHPDTLISLDNLAHIYEAQGRYGEAEQIYQRVLAARERVLGPEHPDTLRSIRNMAELYGGQGRYSEAETLLKRVLAGQERVLGTDHPDTLTTVAALGGLYQVQERFAEAEVLDKRALAARERTLGPEHPATLDSVNLLAVLYEAEGRHDEAEPLDKRALAARERILGPEHPDTLTSLNNLAAVYLAQRRYGEAEPLYKRGQAVSERVLGADHPMTLRSLNNLAWLYFAQSDWEQAAQFWWESTAGLAKRVQRNAKDNAQTLSGQKRTEAEQMSWQFRDLIKAVYRVAADGHAPGVKASSEMFETAQWAQSSEAARSVAQMTARGAIGDAKLAALARERQDLLGEWQKREELRNTWLGLPPEKRNSKAEAENNARLAAIDARIKEIDKEFAEKFPDYALLASPAPLAAVEVQEQLRPDEALIFFLDTPKAGTTPEETFIWVVTKTEMRWARSGLGSQLLAREVQALRCGLDEAAWRDQPCTQLTGRKSGTTDSDADTPPAFDHARAYRLYQALLGQVEDLVEGKSLIIVPSGPLTQLPFQVLVTAPPANGDDASAAWLIRRHALTVLPAVSSLKALRRVAHQSAAAKPFIGFGNPLLDGPDGTYAELAKLARNIETCQVLEPAQVASAEGRGVPQMQTHGGFADVTFLRKQIPLPETAGELCAVARDLGADDGDIYLGARATERQVKGLSASGQLAQYRIVHFATHGALAGQVSGLAEPGLLLTPPESPSEEDDGYLTASEVAGLRLDADWVILSACNTAAGGAQGAEALSGLARAFIYAQARALLVSHWAVNSGATVKLITGAMTRLAAGKSMGRAEAIRQSMLAMIDSSDPREAHPAYWAPFVVVGEGGNAQQ